MRKIVPIIILLFLVVSFQPTSARIPAGTNYFVGFGTSSDSVFADETGKYATYASYVDYVYTRFEWCSVEPSYRSFLFDQLDSDIQRHLDAGRKVIIGPVWKKLKRGTERTAVAGCTDTTPNWLLVPGSIYDPVPSVTTGLVS